MSWYIRRKRFRRDREGRGKIESHLKSGKKEREREIDVDVNQFRKTCVNNS